MSMLPYNNSGPYSPEELRTENDILKMKLMLEYGAEFYAGPGAADIEPEIEHEFLRQIQHFEESAQGATIITVGEKLGTDISFPPVDQLSDGQIPGAIEEVQEQLNNVGIHLSVLSPNISPREIYRFMTEELTGVEMADHFSPGMYCFIYDEFHPDPYYENENTALKYCIEYILRKEDWMALFDAAEFITLNQYEVISIGVFSEKIRRFKNRYKEINCLSVKAYKTTINGDHCVVQGYHETGLCLDNQCEIARGRWQVEFVSDNKENWLVSSVKLENISL